MRVIFVVMLFALATVSAFASVDPHPDQIGVYFDVDEEVACTAGEQGTAVKAFVVVTNPSSDIHGLEFGYNFQAANTPLFTAGVYPPCIDTDLQWSGWPVGDYNNYCGVVSAATDGNTVVAEVQILFVTPLEHMLIYLGPTTVEGIASEMPAYISSEGQVIPLGLSSGDPELPVAEINGECIVVDGGLTL